MYLKGEDTFVYGNEDGVSIVYLCLGRVLYSSTAPPIVTEGLLLGYKA